MAKKKSSKILGFKPTTLAIIGVAGYLLKDKLFPKSAPTSTATNTSNVITP